MSENVELNSENIRIAIKVISSIQSHVNHLVDADSVSQRFGGSASNLSNESQAVLSLLLANLYLFELSTHLDNGLTLFDAMKAALKGELEMTLPDGFNL